MTTPRTGDRRRSSGTRLKVREQAAEAFLVADNQLAERRVLKQTEGFFDGKSRGVTLLLGAAFLAVVAVMDYLLGPRLSVALFYLMPIGLVTWNLGLRWGALTVFLSTAAALWSDLLYPNYDLLPWWNAVFRFAAFLSVAVLLATLRRSSSRSGTTSSARPPSRPVSAS